jgi:hypothetical protein
MIVHPRLGQAVRIHYAAHKRAVAPLHGAMAVVRIVGRGPGPRNHGVEVRGVLHVVPCGQLMKAVT